MRDDTHPSLQERLTGPIVLWPILAIGCALALITLSADALYEPSGWLALLLVPAGIYWLGMVGGAMRVFRTPHRSVSGIDRLVTTGPYARVRHPMYTAHVSLATTLAVVFPSTWFVVAMLWIVLVLIVWIRIEEHALVRKFGDAYREYQQRVPMVIPRWFDRESVQQ